MNTDTSPRSQGGAGMNHNLNTVVTHEVKALVSAYLLARAYAELTRERVNTIYREILTQCPVYADRTGDQIFSPDKLYLCSDDALVRDARDEANKRERASGIKPADMPDDYCPALVAESLLSDVESCLIDASGAAFGITNKKVLCARDGLAKRQKWIDLVVGLVVRQPDFRGPKLRRAA